MYNLTYRQLRKRIEMAMLGIGGIVCASISRVNASTDDALVEVRGSSNETEKFIVALQNRLHRHYTQSWMSDSGSIFRFGKQKGARIRA